MDRGIQTGDPSRGDMRGLRDILDRIRDRRRELLKEGQLADPLADIRERLEEIVERERAGVQRRLDETEPGFEPPEAAGEDGATAGGRWAGTDARRHRIPSSSGCCAASPPSGSTASTRCRPTSARGSARSRTTTSSTATPARRSSRCSTSFAGACSTG